VDTELLNRAVVFVAGVAGAQQLAEDLAIFNISKVKDLTS
jgi:hypothetical protein